MTLRVFVSGQSNALGRAVGGPDWSTIDSRVRVWNNVNPLGANGTAFTSPSVARAGGTFDLTNRNNFGVWFCDRLARHTGDDVDMTIVARGASSIIEWGESGFTYPMRQECLDVWSATGQEPAHVFLWHQGEGDATSMPHAEWRSRFLELLEAMISGGVIDAQTIILLGGVADEVLLTKIEFNDGAIRTLVHSNSGFGYASPRALETTDGTHFDGKALYSFGAERYFTAYREATSMSFYALVNDGGTIGVPGSGENKVLNLDPILNGGYRLRGGPKFLTIDQSYEPDTEVEAILVECIGGGGGGGGASSSGGVARGGNGGGAGGYTSSFIEGPDSSYSVTIGAGGTAGVAGQNAGADGGTTSFGPVLSATGGAGGASSGSSATTNIYGTTPGGLGSGGDINLPGGNAVLGVKLSAALRMGGGGGSTRYGVGAQNRLGSAATSNNPGFPASGYGAGGGGGVSSTTVDQPGSDGCPGVVVVQEFVR